MAFTVLEIPKYGLLLLALFSVTGSQNWRGFNWERSKCSKGDNCRCIPGNLESYRSLEYSTCFRCICRYSWGCAYWRSFRCRTYVNRYRCLRGWGHIGDYNCNIPICRPNCGVGECKQPNTCDCKGLAVGSFCQTLTCSYNRPCYPGFCYNNDQCNCTSGFTKTTQYGCMDIASNNRPAIGRSTVIIQHIRRTDNKFLFNFLLDGTNETMTNLIVWSNQRVFNEMDFEFESLYQSLEPLGERPSYVHETKVGITHGSISMRIINYRGEEHPTQKYDIECSGTNKDNPLTTFNCTLRGEEFKTLIEHADTLNVTFIAENGGYRIINERGNLRPREYFNGQTATKNVYFKFDFQAPKHCSEPEVDGYKLTTCGVNATKLTVGSEFTKKPITMYWKDWTDDKYGSQMWMYYLELHKLVVKDETLKLTELDPTGPMDTANVMHMGNVVHEHTFTPKEPGIYSILLEVRDIANNSRIARRFAVYDKVSDVEFNTNSPAGLHISTAENNTGFKWQSEGSEGQSTKIILNWTDYFMNKAHEDGYYNNEVQAFKVQFQNLEDDGILFARKFVDPNLDDNEGQRRLDAIPSIHGIVEFEYQYTRTVSKIDPPGTWKSVKPVSQTVTINEVMNSGDQIKFWVKGRDNLGNTKTASTVVTADFSPPIVSSMDDNTTTYMVLNVPEGPFNYTSRIHMEAYDNVSSVHELGIEITINMPDQPSRSVQKTVQANTDDTRHPDRDPDCIPSKDKSTCFLKEQTINIDNCWLTVPDQTYLSTASATLIVRAYNQAMLSSSLTFEIPSISELAGLEGYTGPQTAKITDVKTGSFRIVWDFPKQMSCYAIQTTIFIVLYKKDADGTDIIVKPYTVTGSSTYFDIASLDPDTEYTLSFQAEVGGKQSDPLRLTAKTESETSGGVGIGLIIGVAIGVLALVAIVIVIFVVLVRRGYIHPQERARQVKRAVTRKYRNTFYGGSETTGNRSHGYDNAAYNAKSGNVRSKYHSTHEQEELYLYGGMDMNMPEVKHIDRNSITFEGIIKDGHFARIYKATLKQGKHQDVVAAKTLKENFSSTDEFLMRAKINFCGTAVGEHPNILKFLGAVIGDDQMGPFIVYEYCELGTLKDYLTSQKNHLTLELQELLFRFGLDIAKGMEYLAGKGLVHRRLAARNILLTFLKEVKISGFGPQPDHEQDGGSDKQERIPIKWMAPECMTSTIDATEKSDVWSYAVVLWEIFSLGETPYPSMKSRQLPIALKKGDRLPKPEQCDDTWYDVMKRCWEYDAKKRPVFAELRSELDEMFVASPGDDYYYYKR